MGLNNCDSYYSLGEHKYVTSDNLFYYCPTIVVIEYVDTHNPRGLQ